MVTDITEFTAETNFTALGLDGREVLPECCWPEPLRQGRIAQRFVQSFEGRFPIDSKTGRINREEMRRLSNEWYERELAERELSHHGHA